MPGPSGPEDPASSHGSGVDAGVRGPDKGDGHQERGGMMLNAVAMAQLAKLENQLDETRVLHQSQYNELMERVDDIERSFEEEGDDMKVVRPLTNGLRRRLSDTLVQLAMVDGEGPGEWWKWITSLGGVSAVSAVASPEFIARQALSKLSRVNGYCWINLIITNDVPVIKLCVRKLGAFPLKSRVVAICGDCELQPVVCSVDKGVLHCRPYVNDEVSATAHVVTTWLQFDSLVGDGIPVGGIVASATKLVVDGVKASVNASSAVTTVTGDAVHVTGDVHIVDDGTTPDWARVTIGGRMAAVLFEYSTVSSVGTMNDRAFEQLRSMDGFCWMESIMTGPGYGAKDALSLARKLGPYVSVDAFVDAATFPWRECYVTSFTDPDKKVWLHMQKDPATGSSSKSQLLKSVGDLSALVESVRQGNPKVELYIGGIIISLAEDVNNVVADAMWQAVGEFVPMSTSSSSLAVAGYCYTKLFKGTHVAFNVGPLMPTGTAISLLNQLNASGIRCAIPRRVEGVSFDFDTPAKVVTGVDCLPQNKVAMWESSLNTPLHVTVFEADGKSTFDEWISKVRPFTLPEELVHYVVHCDKFFLDPTIYGPDGAMSKPTVTTMLLHVLWFLFWYWHEQDPEVKFGIKFDDLDYCAELLERSSWTDSLTTKSATNGPRVGKVTQSSMQRYGQLVRLIKRWAAFKGRQGEGLQTLMGLSPTCGVYFTVGVSGAKTYLNGHPGKAIGFEHGQWVGRSEFLPIMAVDWQQRGILPEECQIMSGDLSEDEVLFFNSKPIPKRVRPQFRLRTDMSSSDEQHLVDSDLTPIEIYWHGRRWTANGIAVALKVLLCTLWNLVVFLFGCAYDAWLSSVYGVDVDELKCGFVGVNKGFYRWSPCSRSFSLDAMMATANGMSFKELAGHSVEELDDEPDFDVGEGLTAAEAVKLMRDGSFRPSTAGITPESDAVLLEGFGLLDYDTDDDAIAEEANFFEGCVDNASDDSDWSDEEDSDGEAQIVDLMYAESSLEVIKEVTGQKFTNDDAERILHQPGPECEREGYQPTDRFGSTMSEHSEAILHAACGPYKRRVMEQILERVPVEEIEVVVAQISDKWKSDPNLIAKRRRTRRSVMRKCIKALRARQKDFAVPGRKHVIDASQRWAKSTAYADLGSTIRQHMEWQPIEFDGVIERKRNPSCHIQAKVDGEFVMGTIRDGAVLVGDELVIATTSFVEDLLFFAGDYADGVVYIHSLWDPANLSFSRSRALLHGVAVGLRKSTNVVILTYFGSARLKHIRDNYESLLADAKKLAPAEGLIFVSNDHGCDYLPAGLPVKYGEHVSVDLLHKEGKLYARRGTKDVLINPVGGGHHREGAVYECRLDEGNWKPVRERFDKKRANSVMTVKSAVIATSVRSGRYKCKSSHRAFIAKVNKSFSRFL